MPQTVRRALGERLREARLASGLTQTGVALEFGRSRQSISSWEKGKTLPDLTEFAALAKLYGMSADSILFGVDVTQTYAAALRKAGATDPEEEALG